MSVDNGITWSTEKPWPPSYLTMEVSSVLASRGGRVIATGFQVISIRDAGTGSWRSIPRGSKAEMPGYMGKDCIHCIAVSPVDDQHVFAISYSGQVLESHDGGENWDPVPGKVIPKRNREPFLSISGELQWPGTFDLFVGDGYWMERLRFWKLPGSTPVIGRKRPTGEHVDLSQLIFDLDNRTPLFVVGDGGLMKTIDGGSDWTLTGGGKDGLNALQIYDVSGQWLGSPPTATYLYFGTHDNYFWASSDGGATWPTFLCCEGGAFNFERQLPDPDASRIMFSGLVPNGGGLIQHGVTKRMLGDFRFWPAAPSLTAEPGLSDAPILLTGSRFLQSTHSNSWGFKNIYRLTEDWGASWKPGAVALINKIIIGPPAVISEQGGQVLVQAVQKQGLLWGSNLPTYGLLEWKFPAVSQRLSGGELKSLAIDRTGFFSKGIFAVNRLNRDRILAVDSADEQVKYSGDGGITWQPDQNLTELVTQNGKYRFMAGGRNLITTMSWDPDAPCHALVGTRQGGIYRTQDGGRNWHHIDESELIPEVTAFYFPPSGEIVASSYGRGLWRLELDRSPKQCVWPRRRSVPATLAARVVDPVSGEAMPTEPGTPFPLNCRDCRLIVARDGEVGPIEINGAQLVRFALRRGAVYEFDSTGKEVSLDIPNVEPSEIESRLVPSWFPKSNGTQVKAMVVRGDRLVALVRSNQELTFVPDREPATVALGSNGTMHGVAVVALGEVVTLRGEGFAPGIPVEVSEFASGTSRTMPRGQVGADGSFSREFVATGMPGARWFVTSQQDGKRLVKTASAFEVISQEEHELGLRGPEKAPSYEVQ